VYAGRRPRLLGPVFRWAVLLDRWTMPDVALIGAAIGYSRAAARTNVSIDAGGYCFIAAALLCMLSRAALDRRTVWRAIQPDVVSPGDVPLLSCTTCDLVQPMTHEGSPCPRCGERLRARLPDSMLRTLALLIAGALIYAPANFYPMTVTHFVGRSLSYRIIDGVRDLFQAGLWPLGVLIFITSIAIPGLKLIGLGWLQFSIVRRSRRHLRFKSGLYRFIDEVGRWSNVDPFTVPVFVPLFHYRDLVFTDAGGGATAFIFVVVVTMAASRTFDPRLMWDAASEPLHGA
jgi:paraquat-inducible protein A